MLRALQQRLDAVAIRDTRTMNFGPEYQALRIHQKVTLSALDLLAPVVAALFATHISSFDRLAVDYACAGLRIAPEGTRRRSRTTWCILSQVPSKRQVLK